MRKRSHTYGKTYANLLALNKPIAIAAIMLAITSCDHKELCYNHLHTARVNVTFDWRYAPDANPTSMILYLFSEEKGTDDRYDFQDINGGSIVEFAGEYVGMCINGDTQNLRYSLLDEAAISDTRSSLMYITTGTTELLSRLSISAKAAKRAPRANGAEDQRVVLEPDQFWTDKADDISLFASDDAIQQITLYPQQAYCTYTVRVNNVDNIAEVAEVSAALSSQAGGFIPTRNELTDELVTIPFGMEADADSATINGKLLTFGHCPNDADNAHTLTIYVVMNNGAKYYSNIDVTDQIHSAPDQRNVLITVDGLALPNEEISGGFDLTVDSWNSVVIDVEM